MTPKQKAKELVNSIEEIIETPFTKGMFLNRAKHCALITCDEMLSLGSVIGSDLSDNFYIYWREVKQELELL